MAKRTRSKKKEKKNIPTGVVHIQSTFNNTIVTITDPAGNVVAWSSAGVQGFKGSRKSTPFAAGQTAEDAARKAKDQGMRSVEVFIKGPEAVCRNWILYPCGLDHADQAHSYVDRTHTYPNSIDHLLERV